MSIASYDELKDAVARRMHRTDLTAYIPDYIALGEARIYRDLRIRCMEENLSSAITSGVVALPSGYVELKHAYIDGDLVGRLMRKNAEWIYSNYPVRSADGRPKFIAIDAGNFIFGPYPDGAYTIKGTYYKRLTALSASNTTNWFIANAPDLLLYAALCEAAFDAMDDMLLAKFEEIYDRIKTQVQHENDAESFSGSILSVTSA